MTKRMQEVGACGNYCEKCLDFRALAENDDTLRQMAAANIKKEINLEISAEKVGCQGCWGQIHNDWTASVKCRIRQCVEGKDLATCAHCNAFPCSIYIQQFPDNSDQTKNIREIKQSNLETWYLQRHHKDISTNSNKP